MEKLEYFSIGNPEVRSQHPELKNDDIIIYSEFWLLTSRFTKPDGYGRKDDQALYMDFLASSQIRFFSSMGMSDNRTPWPLAAFSIS